MVPRFYTAESEALISETLGYSEQAFIGYLQAENLKRAGQVAAEQLVPKLVASTTINGVRVSNRSAEEQMLMHLHPFLNERKNLGKEK